MATDYRYDTPLSRGPLETWLREQLAKITYKPGWTLDIVRTPGFGPFDAEWSLRIEFVAEDTYNPGRPTKVRSVRLLWGMEHMDETRFLQTVADMVKEVEIHESREWFKVGGVIWDNPHK